MAFYDWVSAPGFWRAVAAIVIWPYYIGVKVGGALAGSGVESDASHREVMCVIAAY